MDDTYYFHQTPHQLAKDLMNHIPILEGDICFEPFRGTGAFYNAFPEYTQKEWCEITEGRDFKEYTGKIDWVISNPPFRLETGTGKKNSFYDIVEYFASRVNKGIAFLGNDYCFSTLTPTKLHKLKTEYGLSISSITVCTIKKWRGRYFFFVLTKEPNSFYKYLLPTY